MARQRGRGGDKGRDMDVLRDPDWGVVSWKAVGVYYNLATHPSYLGDKLLDPRDDPPVRGTTLVPSRLHLLP